MDTLDYDSIPPMGYLRARLAWSAPNDVEMPISHLRYKKDNIEYIIPFKKITHTQRDDLIGLQFLAVDIPEKSSIIAYGKVCNGEWVEYNNSNGRLLVGSLFSPS